jgi:hypothetical protein
MPNRLLGLMRFFAEETAAWMGSKSLMLFNLAIVMPLKVLYFEAIHGGVASAEICARNSPHTEAMFWDGSDAARLACQQIVDRMFRSFEVTVIMSVYFGVLVFVLMRCLLWCLGVRVGGGQPPAPAIIYVQPQQSQQSQQSQHSQLAELAAPRPRRAPGSPLNASEPPPDGTLTPMRPPPAAS